MIEVETATVYRSKTRRWLTKEGAANALAREQMAQRCECDIEDYVDGHTYVRTSDCKYHDDLNYYAAVRDRMARFYLRDLKARENKSPPREAGQEGE